MPKPADHYGSKSGSLDRLADVSDARSYRDSDPLSGDDWLSGMLSADTQTKGSESAKVYPRQVQDAQTHQREVTGSRTREFESGLPSGWRRGDRGRVGEYKVPGEGHLTPQFGGRASTSADNVLTNPNTGQPAEYGYRYEGPGGVEHMEKTGALSSHFGNAGAVHPYTHLSMFPDSRYKDPDSRLLQVKVNQGVPQRVKDYGYAVLSGSIPASDVTDVTDTYEGPSYHNAEKWDPVEMPDDWHESSPAVNEAWDMTNVAVSEAANEAASQVKEGVMTPSKGREYWRGMRNA